MTGNTTTKKLFGKIVKMAKKVKNANWHAQNCERQSTFDSRIVIADSLNDDMVKMCHETISEIDKKIAELKEIRTAVCNLSESKHSDSTELFRFLEAVQ